MRIEIDESKMVVQWSADDATNELLFDIPDDIVPKDFAENAFFYQYDGKKLVLDKDFKKQHEREHKAWGIRQHREEVCFPVINRGEAWYKTLSDKQIEELQDWYQKWLEATETLIEPEPPEWLK